MNLFWKKGYEATTTRDLEVELGLKQSSIYHQFGSKQQLLDLALDRYESLTDIAVLESFESSDTGLAAIKEFYDALAAWVTRDGRRGCMLINMMAEDGARHQEITTRTRRYRRRVTTAISRQLQIAANRGDIAAIALEEKATLLLSLVLGYNIAVRGGASSAELKAMRHAVHVQLDSWQV